MLKRIVGVRPIGQHLSQKSGMAYSLTLREFWFALRLSVWLCWLPIALRRVPLPELLKRFTRDQRPPNTKTPWDVDRAVTIVSRLCEMQLFGLPIFPKPCLRQSLALYRVLTHMGYPVEIHFGVRKQGKELAGHSWVTLQGHPVAERSSLEYFKLVYSHSSGCPARPT